MCNLVRLLCLECLKLSIYVHHVCNSSDIMGESCKHRSGRMIESMNKHAGIRVDSEDTLQQETEQRSVTVLLMLSRLT